MAKPVLDVGGVPSGVHEVDRDRVTQDVRVPALCGQLGGLCVATEKLVDRGRRHWPAVTLTRREEVGLSSRPDPF